VELTSPKSLSLGLLGLRLVLARSATPAIPHLAGLALQNNGWANLSDFSPTKSSTFLTFLLRSAIGLGCFEVHLSDMNIWVPAYVPATPGTLSRRTAVLPYLHQVLETI